MKSSLFRVPKVLHTSCRWLLAIGLLWLVVSCQPNAPLESPEPDPSDDLSIAKAKAWFTDYVASPANARTSADDDFVKNAYWEYAFEHRFNTKNKVVVVPLSHFKRGQKSGFKQLWVYKDKQKKNTLRVVEYFHAESGKGKVLSLKDFTGYMLVKDWDDNFLGGFELKNNNLVGALSKSSKNGRTSGYTCAIGQSCRYVRVGHAEDPSGGYLYLSCITDMVCFWSEVMADNGNNSNGFVVPQDGGGGSNNDCDFQGPLELNKLVNSLSVSNQTKSITPLLSTNDLREKKYEWIILKGFGWYLFSMEVGTHVKTSNANPNLQWEWKSLEHKDISKVGIVIGGSVDYSLRNTSATLGRYNAIMDVDFKVKSSVACAGSPFEIELVYNSNKVFNVND